MPGSTKKRRWPGLAVAGLAALTSGVAVFVNGYAVRAWQEVSTPTVYTTVKNVLAALVLGALLVRSPTPVGGTARWPLLVVALVGGSIPFVLFFEGLARTTASDAAFLHKTLFVWVALLAVPILGERLTRWHFLALALLLAAQFSLTGGLPALTAESGTLMVLAATLLWSVEVIVAKRLLASLPALLLGTARLGLGGLVLVAWVVGSGRAGDLARVSGSQWLWAAVAAVILAVYVSTWLVALQRSPAVDVSAVLVGGAVVTALLENGVRGVPLPAPGSLVLLAAGLAALAVAARRPALRT